MNKFTIALVFVAATQAVKMQKRNKECPAGFYWFDKATGCTDCSVGHFCPTGTKKNPEPCPSGTFQDMLGATAAADCKLCPIGFYADHDGAFECYECPAGYYCNTEGQAEPILCPVNHYCESGSVMPTACPADSHNDVAGADDAGDCFVAAPTICPAGTYNMANNCLDCWEGYFCPVMGMDEPVEMCPFDTYCPAGSVEPTMCPDDYVTGDVMGAADVTACYQETVCGAGMLEIDFECFMCPAGFFCELEDTEEPMWCPSGFYCPAGSVEPTMCPGETTNVMVGATSANECVPLDSIDQDAYVVEEDDDECDEEDDDCVSDDESEGSDDDEGSDNKRGSDDREDDASDDDEGSDDKRSGDDREDDRMDDDNDETDEEQPKVEEK